MSAICGVETSTGKGVAAAISAGSATLASPTPQADSEAVIIAVVATTPILFKFIFHLKRDSGARGSDSVIVKYNTR